MILSFSCLVVPLFVVGLVLLKKGLRPPRLGSMPHCRKCDYNLTGLTSDRCPECGQELAERAIVQGQRQRRPGMVLAGVVCLLPACLVIVQILREVDWYELRPATLIMGDLQSANPRTARRAWKEMERRYLEGKLSETHADEFLGQMFEFELQVRPRVVLGDRVPVRLKSTPLGGESLWIRLRGKSDVLVDGVPSGSKMSFSSSFRGGGVLADRADLEVDVPGKHSVVVTVPVRIYAGKFNRPEESRLCYEEQVALEADFELLATEPPDYLTPIRNPELAAKLKAAIVVESITPPTKMNSNCKLKFRLSNLPVNVAFDVLARMGDQERHLTSMKLPKGTSTRFSTGFAAPLPSEPFDLVLRSNEALARTTVDMFEFWEGELVYEDANIEKRPP